ncbi:hypothetical protein PCASD_03067 [Puccinia coronata f. sp. avenae]|uniref:Uncharacterized protein n=1 Tax=Puccinia coronata f. sp. avenae TaxID=200324 RepID=A0A2N5V5S6_9BASI|nr:hypothetical protein PCASD_03067 [Puccinia coronata f. sp. avenae]
MIRCSVTLFYLTFLLLEIGLLIIPNPTTGNILDIDLNITLEEEEPFMTAPFRVISPTASSVFTSREKQNLPGDGMGSSTVSSTGVDMTISPYATTSSNKHKSWDRDVEQRTKKILCGAERDLSSQVGRAGKDGTNIPEIGRPNHLRLEDFEKAPRNKLKGLRTPRKKNSQKLKIKSTQEEGHSEDFSVSDWQFVKVDQIPPVILNLINGDSDKI